MTIKSTADLRSFSDFETEKNNELKYILGNLKKHDVFDDADFKTKVRAIKDQIIPDTIHIGEPKIKDHRFEQRKMPHSYHHVGGGVQDVNIVTVEFPVTGSPELFNYRTGDRLTVGDIYCTEGASITVDIELHKPEKEAALNDAKHRMSVTYELINQNNAYIDQWAKRMLQGIEQGAARKRKEIFDLYN